MPEACNFIKKETLAQVFSREFCEIFKNIFFTEHLRATAFVMINVNHDFKTSVIHFQVSDLISHYIKLQFPGLFLHFKEAEKNTAMQRMCV